ncbi:glycosyltransferase family 4 protein [Brevundimonas diminuta]|jgi:glycosyltransferase involved in cell wall biosynthesis|uniref:glycosyltransferase family 4 protein n=1 Tax=Brevundimonas diminuta TaxID=293 RepID=UPI0035DA6580
MPARKTILIDGYNIAMLKGTGIATYGRNLVRDYQFMGHDCALLLGGDTLGALSTPTQRKKMVGNHRPPRFRKAWRILNRIAPMVADPEHPKRVGNTSQIGWPERMPKSCELWHGNNLYKDAQKVFRLTGRPLEIQLPASARTALAHWTSPLPIVAKGIPNVTTLHDIIPLTHPTLSQNDLARYKALLKSTLERSDRIITVSEYSRQAISDYFDIDENKIYNAYQSIDTQHQPRPKILLENKLSQDNYFIFSGAVEPKKNITRMLKAYAASNSRLPFVVIGHGGWDNAEDLALLTLMAAEKQIIWLSYLERDELMTLVANAKAMVFTSLAEGFGLPAAEAIALGTPVLASNIPALQEVCGKAAIYVNPLSIEDIVEGFRSVDISDSRYQAAHQASLLDDHRFSTDQHAARLAEIVMHLI